METTLYIFNENGIISSEALKDFSENIKSQSKYKFRIFNKADIEMTSTIFKKFSTEGLEFIIYDYGYLMKLEGEILKVIFFLEELDEIIPDDKVFFLSPIQAVQNSEEYKYPRGATGNIIGAFLDNIFNNKNYTTALNSM